MHVSMMRLKFCYGRTDGQADSRSWMSMKEYRILKLHNSVLTLPNPLFLADIRQQQQQQQCPLRARDGDTNTLKAEELPCCPFLENLIKITFPGRQAGVPFQKNLRWRYHYQPYQLMWKIIFPRIHVVQGSDKTTEI